MYAPQCFLQWGGGVLTGGNIQHVYPNPWELDRVP